MGPLEGRAPWNWQEGGLRSILSAGWMFWKATPEKTSRCNGSGLSQAHMHVFISTGLFNLNAHE